MTSGEALLTEMRKNNISLQELSKRLKLDLPFIGEIISDQRAINAFIAMKLTSVFDNSVAYWLKFHTANKNASRQNA
jgi:plasmid maintenance system antidote protein VapI